MRPRFTFLAVLLMAILPAAPALASTPSAAYGASLAGNTMEQPGVGIRLLDVPAATQNDPRARSYIVDHLSPGTTIERRIEIANGTNVAQDFRIYPSAASIDKDAFSAASGEVENELTTWTSVDRKDLVLAPGTSTEVMITVDVPADAPEGEQYAVVWAQASPSANMGKGIVNASRLGVRMYVSVGPGNGPASDFSIDSFTPGRNQSGVPEVTATVTNTGGRALDISGALTLSNGPAGLSAGPVPIDKGTSIAPGDSAIVHVTLPAELPNGPWLATLSLKSGLVAHDVNATITFPEKGQGAAVAPDKKAIPLTLVIVLAVCALVVAGLAFWLIRRRKRTSNRVPVT